MFFWFQGPLMPKSIEETFPRYSLEERAFVKLLQQWLPEKPAAPAEFCHCFECALEEARVEPTKFPDPNYLAARMRIRMNEIATGLFDQTFGDAVESYMKQTCNAQIKEEDQG